MNNPIALKKKNWHLLTIYEIYLFIYILFINNICIFYFFNNVTD